MLGLMPNANYSKETLMKGSKGGFGKGKGSGKKGFVAGPAVMTGKKGMK